MGPVEAELGGKGQEAEHGLEVGEGPGGLGTFSLCAERSCIHNSAMAQDRWSIRIFLYPP